MSNANLPAGAFLTQLNGRRCTAVPRNGGGGGGNNNGGNNGGNNNGGNNGGGNNNNNGGGGRNQRTTEPPARSTNAPPPQETFSTTTSSPPPPPALTTSSPPPPPVQTTPPAQAQPQQPPPSSSSPAPVANTSAPPPPPPAAIPIPSASSPLPEVQNGGAEGTGAGAGAGTGTGASTTAQTPPPQAAQPAPSSALASSIARFSVIPDNQPAPPAQPAVTSVATDDQQPSTASTASPPPAADVGAAPAGSSPPPAAAEPSNPPVAENSPAGNFPLATTIGTASPTDGAAAAGGGVTSNTPQVSAVAQDSGASGTTIAVAGGVAGGVLLISLAAFFFWLIRKRKLKKRRSTLLTPLSPSPSNGRFPTEKRSYVINRGSIGPTPRTEKLKASLGYSFSKIRGRVGSFLSARSTGSSSGGVNMNRGNSQFIESPAAVPSRSGSTASRGPRGGNGGGGWFGGMAAGIGGWRKARDADRNRELDDPFGGAQEKKAPVAGANNNGAQPDFLTLLGMDDREVQREAQRKRASRNGSASSGDHFLGSLGLSFNNSNGGKDDPFSDSDALANQSVKPAPPPAASAGGNPFSDANAIQPPAAAKPSTYVSDVQRSRGPSISAGTGAAGSNAYSRAADSYYNRESVNSVDSFKTRRDKFRSDPFDLERPELLGRVTSSNFSTAGSSNAPRLSTTTTNSTVQRPGASHQRLPSLGSSKYSSGMSSLGDWSDPGPDVGPAANRPVSPVIGRGESPTQGLTRTGSTKSAGVGKAL